MPVYQNSEPETPLEFLYRVCFGLAAVISSEFGRIEAAFDWLDNNQ
jgi:hypothetical protein